MKSLKKSKIVFILISFTCFISILVSSCSSDVECIVNNNTTNSKDTKKIQLELFKQSIDSLNEEYGISKSRSFWSGAIIPVADASGRYIGTSAGNWLGGAIGLIGGNPGTVAIGMLAGRFVGSFVGQSLASGIAGMFCYEPPIHTLDSINQLPRIKANFNLNVYGTAKEDSLGYFHNNIMAKLKGKRFVYGFDDEFKPELIYDDVIAYCKEYGYYDEVLENLYVKQAFINIIMKVTDEASTGLYGFLTEEAYINRQANILTTECLLDNETINQFREFDADLAISCAQLSTLELSSYSQDLNTVISTADLTIEDKTEFALSAQIVINSTLCWRE